MLKDSHSRSSQKFHRARMPYKGRSRFWWTFSTPRLVQFSKEGFFNYGVNEIAMLQQSSPRGNSEGLDKRPRGGIFVLATSPTASPPRPVQAPGQQVGPLVVPKSGCRGLFRTPLRPKCFRKLLRSDLNGYLRRWCTRQGVQKRVIVMSSQYT